MNLFIEPLDVLLFRKNQPFVAGEGSRAVGLFPPSVVPFLGAVRTALAKAMGVSFVSLRDGDAGQDSVLATARSLLGHPLDEEDGGRLRLRGPYLARRTADGSVEALYPVPRNTLWQERSDHGVLRPLVPRKNGQQQSVLVGGGRPGFPSGMELLVDAGGEVAGSAPQGVWLTAAGLRRALQGDTVREEDTVRETDLYCSELRTGIEIDHKTRAAATGMLYGVSYIRVLPGVGFLLTVEIEGEQAPRLTDLLETEGFLCLGGERRAVYYSSSERPTLGWDESAGVEDNSGCFTLYLATPAVFRHNVGGDDATGWLPRWINDQNLTTEAGRTAPFQVVAAAIGKPIPVGGWDLARRQPKPLRWAVPAGSVYYCRTLSGESASLSELQGKTISDFLPHAGMGEVIVGRWQYAG